MSNCENPDVQKAFITTFELLIPYILEDETEAPPEWKKFVQVSTVFQH